MARNKKNKNSLEFAIVFLVIIICVLIVAFLNPNNFFEPFADWGKVLGIAFIIGCITFTFNHFNK